MITFFKIGWRNILRNPRRSLIISLVIAVGFLGMVLTWALTEGFFNQFVNTIIYSQLSHIQIHIKGFNDNPVIKNNIKEPQKIYDLIKNNKNIKFMAQRIKSQGIISTPESSAGVMIIGIDPVNEVNVSNIKKLVIEGTFLQADDKPKILLGKKLVEKLKVEIGEKVVLMAQNMKGEVGGIACRLTGIFQSDSPDFDKAMVFITLNTALKFFEIENSISEFAIIIKNSKLLDEAKKSITSVVDTKKYEVLTWKEIMPAIAKAIEMTNGFMYIFFLIIMVAIVFSIINTLFVIIFERFKELGIMKALGTKPFYIFSLVIIESFWLTIIGIIIGIVLSIIILGYFSNYGLDLSFYAKGMSLIGMSSILYPVISFDRAVGFVLLTIFISGLASIYPAVVAAKIKAVNALKFI